MYITCSKCQTKFIVAPEQIGSDGRKVKCSKCNYIWHQQPLSNGKIPPMPKAIIDAGPSMMGNGVNLPALLPIKMPSFLYGLPVLLIGMIIFLTFILFSNFFGVHPILNNKRLITQDLQLINDIDRRKITVTFKVFNPSGQKVKMPLVRIRLLDENNKIISTKIEDYSAIDLYSGQSMDINTEFAEVPIGAKQVHVIFGNKLDFILW